MTIALANMSLGQIIFRKGKICSSECNQTNQTKGEEMLIVVNHLTRMEKGYICTAGIDEMSGRHVRPILGGGIRLGINLLAEHGGIFRIGERIELGKTLPKPHPPEVEDHVFNANRAVAIGRLEADDFWKLLSKLARSTLVEIFGPDLQRIGFSSAGTSVGKGIASLGCWTPSVRPVLHLQTRPEHGEEIHLRIHDGAWELDPRVTDIRLYEGDHCTPDAHRVEEMAERLEKAEGIILCLGLTRAWSPPDSNQKRMHWLQVTNIHLRDIL